MTLLMWWEIIRIWLLCFVIILLSEMVLLILNCLQTVNFKWSLRFLFAAKLIMLGIGYLIYKGVQPYVV